MPQVEPSQHPAAPLVHRTENPDGNRSKLEVQTAIIERILAGAEPEVAATAEGVSIKRLNLWMGSKAGVPFRRLLIAAQGDAISNAETRVFAKDPKTWLGKFPATRDTWGDEAPRIGTAATHNGFKMMQVIMDALLPFPEAAQAVSKAVSEADLDSDPNEPRFIEHKTL